MSTHRFHVNLPLRQWHFLESVSLKTGYSHADVVRLFVERSLAEPQLNEAFPSLSGQITPAARTN